VSEHSYRLATYAAGGGHARAGIVIDDRVVDVGLLRLGALGGGETHGGLAVAGVSVLDVLNAWSEVHPQLQRAARSLRVGDARVATLPLAEVRLLAPVQFPGTIFCAGANYKDHVAEMSRALNLPSEPDPHEIGLKPWHFIKPAASCIRGTGDTIALPAYSKKVDWEAEIAVVIGRECRNVGVERALDHVAGLSIVNDLSARDHLRRAGVAIDSPFHFDWVSQKSFDGALPFGPWIVPLDDLPEVGALGIKLWVNDELMQNSSSANLIFSMSEQIAHLSTRLTLRPGDVIATGTPAGCGSARGQFLKSGDHVRLWVEGIGELVNHFSGESVS
jgi:2-keto-4-pentenoate hydratase/2-oxohepta-3-ene-1,7-dioic acid hydratase in catechol pathway